MSYGGDRRKDLDDGRGRNEKQTIGVDDGLGIAEVEFEDHRSTDEERVFGHS
jgi:hypothetical protein